MRLWRAAVHVIVALRRFTLGAGDTRLEHNAEEEASQIARSLVQFMRDDWKEPDRAATDASALKAKLQELSKLRRKRPNALTTSASIKSLRTLVAQWHLSTHGQRCMAEINPPPDAIAAGLAQRLRPHASLAGALGAT